MVITPTMTHASGTWTSTLKHEKMIKTAQRKMLRLIVQTKRKYKSKKATASKKGEGTDKLADEENEGTSDKDRRGLKTQTKIKAVTYLSRTRSTKKLMPLKNEEDWIEYIKRSTKEAEEHMEKQKIPCWIEIRRRMMNGT